MPRIVPSLKPPEARKMSPKAPNRPPNPSQNRLRMVTKEISKAVLQKNMEMSIRPIICDTSSRSTTSKFPHFVTLLHTKTCDAVHRDESAEKDCPRQPPGQKNVQKGLQDGPGNVSRAVANFAPGPSQAQNLEACLPKGPPGSPRAPHSMVWDPK